MFEPKAISRSAIPAALAKAERYRLLNEPREAESICQDVLRIDTENREAIVMLILALTDQFGAHSDVDVEDARELLKRLRGEYERLYYSGVIWERWGKSLLARGLPAAAAHDWLRRAMDSYESAEAHSPEGNDDAILRWNACARTLMRHQDTHTEPTEELAEPAFDDEAPGW